MPSIHPSAAVDADSIGKGVSIGEFAVVRGGASLGDGVTMDDVAKAHAADLATQGAHGVKYLRYWVDEEEGQIFCLVEAPNAEAANSVHREAHGLVADRVYAVQEGT